MPFLTCKVEYLQPLKLDKLVHQEEHFDCLVHDSLSTSISQKRQLRSKLELDYNKLTKLYSVYS